VVNTHWFPAGKRRIVAPRRFGTLSQCGPPFLLIPSTTRVLYGRGATCDGAAPVAMEIPAPRCAEGAQRQSAGDPIYGHELNTALRWMVSAPKASVSHRYEERAGQYPGRCGLEFACTDVTYCSDWV